MKLILYKPFLLILLLLLSVNSNWAQESVSKKIEKTYPLTNTGELHIENKYGNVIINGWEKKTIQVSVEIQVIKKKKEDAEALIKRINSTINNTEDFISITTVIEEKSLSMFSRLFEKTNPFDFDRGNIQIDYVIYLPFNTEIDITNKFGDIIISSWDGKLKANLQHGDMWINENLSNANIEIKFGELKTKNITYGNIQIKNGKIDIQESKNLKIRSSGANVEIENVERLEIRSSKDQISIDKIGTIQGELMFSNTNLNTVYENINLTTEVADLWISKIQKVNADVTINQESSEININITGLAIDFNASLEQGLLRIPKSFTNVKTNIIDKRKRIRDISATYGKSNEYGKFQITGKKGIIILTE